MKIVNNAEKTIELYAVDTHDISENAFKIGKTDIYFRVADVYKDVEILVKSGEDVILKSQV